ncbi:MAG: hypothetical protein GF417_11640 [Candidatus Latescibacteria bacterium]|nr:hypothetical protein [bacterium]MBD3425077.1 hypothetical protein [Candidatus Latescibacterota bacterium]
MRKVLVVLMALTLSGMFISCSEDEETVTPTPSVDDLSITTSSLASGCTCSPYNVQLEAEGGKAPYTWDVTTGSLPTGYELTADGIIKGMASDIAETSFTVTCTDDDGETTTADLSITVDVPSNPSIGIFYDEDAAVCTAQATAFLTQVDCYVYIMLEDCEYDCTTGAQFKVSLVDSDGQPLDSSKYAITYTEWPDYSLSIGSLFNGVGVAFTRPLNKEYQGPIEVVKFGLMLLEDVDELAFKVEADPNESEGHDQPIITQCDQDHTKVEVGGRDAAINYTE